MRDFPTLDMLRRYGLDSAYIILVLGAKSATHLQDLCENVVPIDCRLPRSLVIALKKERERLLGHGGPTYGASDEFLLEAFEDARRTDSGGYFNLLEYFGQQLDPHSRKTYYVQGDAGTYGVLIENEGEDLHSRERFRAHFNCTVNGVPAGISFEVRIKRIEVKSGEDGLILPQGLMAFKTEWWIMTHLDISCENINRDTVASLLTLPRWDGLNKHGGQGNWTIVYQSKLSNELVPLGRTTEAGRPFTKMVITSSRLTQLVDYIRNHDVPFELTREPTA